MSEPPVPPEPDDEDPFENFVNHELHFGDVESEPTPEPVEFNAELDDDEDDEDDLPSMRFSFGARFRPQLITTISKRSAEFPDPDDPRWLEGVFAVDSSLRIYKQPEYTGSYQLFPNAHFAFNRRVRYIRDEPFPWTAVSFADPTFPDGYVLNGSIQFFAATGVWATARAFFASRTNQLQLLLLICLIQSIMLIATVFERDSGLSTPAPLPAIQATVAAQGAELDALQATLEAFTANSR